jgi:hypothetical protein
MNRLYLEAGVLPVRGGVLLIDCTWKQEYCQ